MVTGGAFNFSAIGRHDDTMQKLLDGGRAHLQPANKSRDLPAAEEKALMDEQQELRTRRDAQRAVSHVAAMNPFEDVGSRREQEPEQRDSDETPRIEVDEEGTRLLNKLFFWIGKELRARRDAQPVVAEGATSTPFLKSNRRGDRL